MVRVISVLASMVQVDQSLLSHADPIPNNV
jgi:hypothetical protein